MATMELCNLFVVDPSTTDDKKSLFIAFQMSIMKIKGNISIQMYLDQSQYFWLQMDRKLWKLRSCSDKIDILLQDAGYGYVNDFDEKWFTYNAQDKAACNVRGRIASANAVQSSILGCQISCMDK